MADEETWFKSHFYFTGGHEFKLINSTKKSVLEWQEHIRNAEPFVIKISDGSDYYMVNPFNVAWVKFTLQEGRE